MKKKILTVVFVLPFFLSAVLCCCLEGFAAPAPSVSVEHCHSHADQDAPQDHPHKTDDCQCPKSISLSSRSYDLESVSGSLRSGENLFAAVTPFVEISQGRVLQALISSGPPWRAFDVPIYLRDSVLRI